MLLVKLASIKRAIDYVLRCRNCENNLIVKIAEDNKTLKNNTDTISSIPGIQYNDISSFKRSGLPLRKTDTIKLPQGQILVNRVGTIPFDDPKLNSILDESQEIFDVAPYFKLRKGSLNILEPSKKEI